MWFKSEKEMSHKQKLEESIRKFLEFYDKFIQNKTQLESDVFDHLSRVSISNRWTYREAKGKNRWHCFRYYWQEIGRNLLKKSQRERVDYLRPRHLTIEKALDKQIERNWRKKSKKKYFN